MKHRLFAFILVILLIVLMVSIAQAKPFTTRKGITFGMDYDDVCASEAKQKLLPKEGTMNPTVFEENVQYAKVPVTLTYEYSDGKMSQIIYEAVGEDKEYNAILGQATKELGKPVQQDVNDTPAFPTPLYTESMEDVMVEYTHWHTTYDDYDVIADLWRTDDNHIKYAISFADQALTHPALKSGAKGEGVKIIQRYLIEYGYLKGDVTGNFDSATTKALKDFQYNNGQKETSICDENVWLLFEGRPVRQEIVYKSKKGKVYHSDSTCSGMRTAKAMTLTEALKKGLRPCSHCH